MNQLSVSGMDEITTFGFFNINLNLVISVSVPKNTSVLKND
jgi:hypothetical protein